VAVILNFIISMITSTDSFISYKVPLDYSLKAYLEVMFLNPRMKVTVQGSPVNIHMPYISLCYDISYYVSIFYFFQVITCHLEKSLDKKSFITDEIMGRTINLTLGRSDVEWGRVNCGVFLYWHGRLIEVGLVVVLNHTNLCTSINYITHCCFLTVPCQN
jgi:hypothetical protein